MHKIAFFMHRSICGAANIQLLNWSKKCGDSNDYSNVVAQEANQTWK